MISIQYCIRNFSKRCFQISVLRNYSVFQIKSHKAIPTYQRLSLQRFLRTSPRHNALPPALWLALINRAGNLAAAICGRLVRRWWKKLPNDKKKMFWRRGGHPYVISGTINTTVLGSYLYYLAHIEEAPITGRKRFMALNDDQIQKLSEQFLIEELMGRENDLISPTSAIKGEYYTRVQNVGYKLLKANEDVPQLQGEWDVTVIDDIDTVDCHIYPCRSIVVTTGLLSLCDNESQLAIFLGHEMAHAVLRHSTEETSMLHFLDMLFFIPMAALWALLPSDIGSALGHYLSTKLSKLLMELPYSRLLENEADEVGLMLAAKACFDIREAPVIWAKMGALVGNVKIAWLSTHPTYDKRREKLENLLPVCYNIREKCQCTALPASDPRQNIKAFDNFKFTLKRFQSYSKWDSVLL